MTQMQYYQKINEQVAAGRFIERMNNPVPRKISKNSIQHLTVYMNHMRNIERRLAAKETSGHNVMRELPL